MRSNLVAALLAATAFLQSAPTEAGVVVGTKLSLVVDVSGSISPSEYSLMMNGYKNAFLNGTVQSNILSQTNGIAVNVVQFGQTAASNSPQWYHLDSVAAINAFANALGTMARNAAVGTWTNIAKGMEVSTSILASNSLFESSRLVMDVSGDGRQNRNLQGNLSANELDASTLALVTTQRNAAAAAGIKVNGLAITTDVANLDAYYTSYVKTTDGFVVKANNFQAFENAVLMKIEAETRPQEVPEPGSMVVFASLAAVAGFSRLRRNNRNPLNSTGSLS